MENRDETNWMKHATALLCSLVMVGSLTLATAAKDEDKDDTEICDKRFKVFTRDGETELGTYRIQASTKTAAKEIEIVEAVSMVYRGKKLSLESTVTYDTAATAISPTTGTAETTLDGKVCMKGSVALSNMKRTYSFEAKGFLDKRSGEKIDPPSKFAKDGQPLPEGAIIFQSALIAIGPKFLPQAGELKNVVWVEFPDDIGASELINFKEEHRMVRTKADAGGEFELKLYEDETDEQVVAAVRYSKGGKIVSISSYGKLKLVEVKEED